jgi:deoxyribodipyrimidine photo-lyase
MKSLYWLRNDLRLHDNVALNHFSELAITGIFAWCPTASFFRADTLRRHFILASLLEFKTNIEKLGGLVIIFRRLMSEVLPTFIRQNAIEAVFYSTELTPEEKAEEALLANIENVKVYSTLQSMLIHPKDLTFTLDRLPSVFTHYRKLVEDNLIVHPPTTGPLNLPPPITMTTQYEQWEIKTELLPLHSHAKLMPGEQAGLSRIEAYIFKEDRLRIYKETRNGMLNWDDSSKLSAWLSVGAISARQVYAAIVKYEAERCKNESTYWLFFELLWRDYFRLTSDKLQEKLFTRLSPYANNDKQSEVIQFKSWCEAKTGDDFIDANMQELNQSGWMSNRGRQNVASYLAKVLRVDWRLGAAYFERKLIDYDACSNWGNWAYLAGVGQDPRDRLFNPQVQAQRYDTAGLYRTHWLTKRDSMLTK